MNDQLDLLSMVRSSDPETSRWAALSTNRAKGKRRVLGVLAARVGEDFTDEEIAGLADMHAGSASKRRGDLEKDGLVRWSGRYRPTSTGCQARCWTVTADGVEAWRAL